MIKKTILPLFALTCLAQWFVPAQMIYDQEQVLREGKTYHFKTAPIDPSDPFRGKYITLSFERCKECICQHHRLRRLCQDQQGIHV
jgi:uncharacterized membrane-anchored protein